MLTTIKAKIADWEAASVQVQSWKAAGERIVFTNGCFDLLHYGHLCYLAQARELGDRLVIGLNDAGSVRRLKGPHRPINDELTRELQMASLQFVDLVVTFAQDTPLELIQLLRPDVLVKGGDYAIDEIVGAEAVQQHGGEVRVLPFIEGYSTTNIEAKIRKQSL
jgi:D-beta-D-heptose 7-phosphate kinase/D-beta-D-heptose 1-phosphate adenosyltransferase